VKKEHRENGTRITINIRYISHTHKLKTVENLMENKNNYIGRDIIHSVCKKK